MIDNKKRKTLFEKTFNSFLEFTTPSRVVGDDFFLVWKSKLLNILYIIGAIFGFPTLISSIKLSMEDGLYFLVVIDILAYGWVILNLFVKIHYKIKAISFVLMLNLIGFVLLIGIGPFAPGLIWLFSIPILALIFFEQKTAYIILAINMLIFVLIGILLEYKILVWQTYTTAFTFELWLVFILNFLFLNLLIVVSLSGLVNGLQKSTQDLKASRKKIEDEHILLSETNLKLQNEIEFKIKMEKQLVSSQNRLARATAATKIGFWELDLISKEIWGSLEAFEIYGFDPKVDTLSWSLIHSIVHHEDVDINEKAMMDLLNQNKEYDIKFRINKYNTKELIWVHSKAELLKDEKNQPLKVTGVIIDITKDEVNQLALLKSETLYKTLFSDAKDGILLIKDGLFVECNQQALDLFVCTKDMLIGKSPSELSPNTQLNGEKSDEFANNLINNALKGETQHFDWIHNRFDGTIFYSEITLSRMELNDGFYVQTIIRDVTEKRQSELLFKQNEERLIMALEASSDVLWDFNFENNELYVSNRLFKLLGYNENELSLNQETWLRLIHPEDLKEVNKITNIAIANKQKRIQYEYRLNHKSNEWIWVLSRGKVVESGENDIPIRIVGTMTDLTQRIQNEERIKQMNIELEKRVSERTAQLESTLEELQFENEERKRTQEELYFAKNELQTALETQKQLNELKTRFVSMVSHEYRSPLTVILSSTYILDILFEKGMKDDFVANISKIQESVKSMTKLLDDVLLVGETGNENVNVHKSEVDLILMSKQLLEEIKFSNKNKQKFEFLSSASKLFYRTDESLLRYILIHLLNNSSKYSPEGSTIILEVHESSKTITFKVSDSGIGIPKEDQAELFQPFYRSKNVGAISGTGLGLAIVKTHVNMLDGEIFVTSEENEGSTFTLKFPK